ncbi:MAG: OmpA family protein [Pseudomonadota bacterium]
MTFRFVLALSMAFLLAACQSQPVQTGLPAPAETPPAPPVPGYLTARDGSLQKDEHQRCWRTADWRPAYAIEECDPVVVRRRQAAQMALALAAVAPVAVLDETAAAAPAPEPSPQATLPVDFVTKPVVLNTDAAFFFGKDTLTQAGRDAVENLAAYVKLWGIEGAQVEITGHTDRIGHAKDNLALSKRRAESVRRVMVESGLPPEAVVARGVGSTRPVTTLADCPADLVRCDLIGCLAPDRRVEVRLNGTRKAPVR